MGANIDDNIGRLDRFLAKSGFKENTIVVFLTENGSTMGQDYFNAGMRGKKTRLWEGGHRVPCFLRWPGGDIDEPREMNELCHVQDLLPTLGELAGVANVPAAIDGDSLSPIFRGQAKTLGDRKLVINYSRMPTFKVKYTQGNPAIPMCDGAGVLWRKWRLLENRELYDIENDLHQDLDVAGENPEVVAEMRSHLEGWWQGVKDDVMTPLRVIIGSDQENPLLLTAFEWLDVFVDQQGQVRRGDRKNGTWYLTVDQAGEYEFELRRWPRESGLTLQAEVEVTDGVFQKGVSLPIHSASLRVGTETHTLSADSAQTHCRKPVRLDAGPIEITATFLDANGQEICGAYYLNVERK